MGRLTTTQELLSLSKAARPKTTRVTLGWIDNGMVHHAFAVWLLRFWAHDAAHRGYVAAGAGGGLQSRSPVRYNLADGRNQLIEAFLAGRGEWLWMVDADESWPLDALYQLADAADPEARPIMAGAYLYQSAADRSVWPSFGWPEQAPWEGGERYPRTVDAMAARRPVEVAWAGGGCLLIHRTVLEALAARNPGPWPWFGYDPNPHKPGVMLTEDMTFCARARGAGFPIFAHTGVRGVHHDKAVDLRFEH